MTPQPISQEALWVAEVLERAADLIGRPGAFVKGVHALDADGRDDCTAETAICFCALGAISVAAGCDPSDEAGHEAQGALLRAIEGQSIPDWNDAPKRTQAEVVAKLREAAAKAKEAGQ